MSLQTRRDVTKGEVLDEVRHSPRLFRLLP